jgi:hypothetical protein
MIFFSSFLAGITTENPVTGLSAPELYSGIDLQLNQ